MSNKRSIFQEVDGSKPDNKPQTGLISKPTGARTGIRLWLMLLFSLLVVMIAVGGLTRLTDSGLSITEWNVIKGAIPPMNEAAWLVEFEKYKTIPEFQYQNANMDMAGFKTIYWWEWGHRQLGRVLGLVWAVGFVAFWAMGKLPTGWTSRLLILGALGGLQGAIGWWMVSSGLTGRMVDVASYRLATHLGLAFFILGLITWFILLLGRDEASLLQSRRGREGKLFSMTTGLMHLTGIQILLGALVAGIDAGRGHTDWPLMLGRFFPADAFTESPFWVNFFENAGLVQFNHRMVGYLLLIFAVVVWRKSRASGNVHLKGAYTVMMAMMLVQMGLGIFTVLNAAPWQWGIMHQLGAVALWVLVIRARFNAGYPARQAIKGAK